jgi:hypothetical protein
LTAKYENQESTSLLQDINLGPLEPSSTLEKTVYITSLSPGSKLIDISLQTSLTNDESQRIEEINHTLTLDVEAPFGLSSQVMYRHASRPSSDGVEGWATVMSLLTLPGRRGVNVDSISVEAKVSSYFIEVLHADGRMRLSLSSLHLLINRETVSRKVGSTKWLG